MVRGKKSPTAHAKLESEAYLRAVLETAVDAIIAIDQHGHVASFNPAAERMFGYKAEEVIGKNVSVLMPAPDREHHDEYIKRYLLTGRARIIGIGREVTAMRKDGSTFPMDLAVSEVKAREGHIFVGIARDTSERKRLEEAVVMATENERQVVGQDLHDVLGQHLTGVVLMAKAFSQKMSQTNPASAGEANNLMEMGRNALNEARRLAHGLYPTELLRSGLGGALEELADNQGRFFHVSCIYRGERNIPELGQSTALNLYRIAQEAITNAIKHGKSKHIVIRLFLQEEDLMLQVEDDGVGIAKKRKEGKGMGLPIMKYRSSIAGASLQISPAPRGGTIVRCCIHNWRRQLSGSAGQV